MFEEKKREKTSAEMRKEEKERKGKEARQYALELDRIYNSIRGKFLAIDKTGEIPEEGVLRGHRKKLQDLSSGIAKLRRAGTAPTFNQGQVNILVGKLRRWMDGEVTKTKKTETKRSKSQELGEILRRVQSGSTTADPAIQEAVRLLREAARDKMMSGDAVMVAKRACRLMQQQKKSQVEMENYIKDKLVMPILDKVFKAFLVVLETTNVHLDEDVKNYVETCIKGAKSRKEFIHMLLSG